MARKHYDAIDGLRTIACIGIVMMHMHSKSNNSYEISGIVFDRIIPFLCFLLKSRIRAWFALVSAIFYNVACTEYFMDSKHVVDNMNPRINFLYSAMFFMAGCMIYLYRTELRLFVKKFRWLVFMTVAAITIFYFLIPEKNAKQSSLQSHDKNPVFYQYGNIPLPYGYFPCDRKNAFKLYLGIWVDLLYDNSCDGTNGSNCLQPVLKVFSEKV